MSRDSVTVLDSRLLLDVAAPPGHRVRPHATWPSVLPAPTIEQSTSGLSGVLVTTVRFGEFALERAGHGHTYKVMDAAATDSWHRVDGLVRRQAQDWVLDVHCGAQVYLARLVDRLVAAEGALDVLVAPDRLAETTHRSLAAGQDA